MSSDSIKKVLELLYKDKKPEEQPIKLEIKLMSTATPNEQLDINQWHQLIYEMNNKKSQMWNSGQLVKMRALQKCGALSLNQLV